MLLSFLVEGGAAAAGWTAYPPLSAVAAAAPGSGLGQTVWLLSMALFIASFTMSGLNFIATIFNDFGMAEHPVNSPFQVTARFTKGPICLGPGDTHRFKHLQLFGIWSHPSHRRLAQVKTVINVGII